MINFYSFYNKTGLDNQHYAPLIDQLLAEEFNKELEPIEHIIKTHSYYSYMYAKYVIKGRWISAEYIIMKDPWAAFSYAQHVMKERWLEAEPYMKQHRYAWHHYCLDFGL